MSYQSTMLDIAGIHAARMLAYTAQRHGFTTEFFYPKIDSTIYGTDDAQLTYAAKPTQTYKALISGLFGKRFFSDKSLDVFTQDEYKIFFAPDSAAPEDTKCIVHMSDTVTAVFRIKYIQANYGHDPLLLKVGKLVPIQ